MFFNAVVIVLQEILEAALMLSLLLAFGRYFNLTNSGHGLLRRNWVVVSVLLGVFFAWLYSKNLALISDSFDYVGLEIINASIHATSVLFLVFIVWLFPKPTNTAYVISRLRVLTFSMVVVVALAILREGSEIMQFVGGVLGQGEAGLPVLYGGLIGAGIGLSAGILLYYGLTALSMPWSLKSCVLLLALTAGNMASQAVLLLNQADWVPFSPIAWDSNTLLNESSVMGQLAYALIGYEATPSLLQVFTYFLGIVAVLASPIGRFAWVEYHGSDTPQKKGVVE